jgi:hypothetical protein
MFPPSSQLKLILLMKETVSKTFCGVTVTRGKARINIIDRHCVKPATHISHSGVTPVGIYTGKTMTE